MSGVKVPASVFDAGTGQPFESVHVSRLETPDGVFASDGAVLVHWDWCDDQTLSRIEYAEPRVVPAEWWNATVRVRKTNIVDGYPRVTIRPWYEITLTEAGGQFSWRSAAEEALIVLDDTSRVRAVVAGMSSPYSPDALSEHRPEVSHLIRMYERQMPSMHPHHAALAALIAVDERLGGPATQHHLPIGSENRP